MARKDMTDKSDEGMWFRFPDGHLEKCRLHSAKDMWPELSVENVGAGADALRLRAIHLIEKAGRYGRFHTYVYYREGDLQFLRFEKNDRGGVDYVFKNTATGNEVNATNLNMKEVNALHEVIDDSWDALQYERYCRGMNYQGGLYHDGKVSDEDLENARKEGVSRLYEYGVLDERSSSSATNYGPYVYAVGELFSHNPNFDAIVDVLNRNGVMLGNVSKAYDEFKQSGLSDSWYERFDATYKAANRKRQEQMDGLYRALASAHGTLVGEVNAEILWNAVVDYNSGELDFPKDTHLSYQSVDGCEHEREVFIRRLYRDRQDGLLKCDVYGDAGYRGKWMFSGKLFSQQALLESMAEVPGMLNPLKFERGTNGLFIDRSQKMKALEYVRRAEAQTENKQIKR